MRIVTGCLRPTPTDLLSVMVGIFPPSLRRKKATHRLAQQAVLDENHALNQLVTQAQPDKRQRLKSHHPFPRHAAILQESKFSILEAWRSDWDKTPKPDQFTVQPNTEPSPGLTMPRKEWVKLNRLRTGVGRFNNNMLRWGLSKSPFCNCRSEPQTAEHVIYHCPIHRPQNGNVDLTAPDETTVQ